MPRGGQRSSPQSWPARTTTKLVAGAAIEQADASAAPLQPTPLELVFAREAIKEKKLQDEARELQNEANRALIRHLAENTSASQKNSQAKKNQHQAQTLGQRS